MADGAASDHEFIVNKPVQHSPTDPCLRTGAQFVESLRDSRTVIMNGREIDDVTREPVLRRCGGRGVGLPPPLRPRLRALGVRL